MMVYFNLTSAIVCNENVKWQSCPVLVDSAQGSISQCSSWFARACRVIGEFSSLIAVETSNKNHVERFSISLNAFRHLPTIDFIVLGTSVRSLFRFTFSFALNN